ncbi:hypothetical protein RclHR1_02980021 [Rhizophagus clarus]|uniref:Uncharacterized protein n=1 Tax=Rhizophagus clarus TaxID=94130 RepID=A0A2Z6R8U8_9GLOM|nr:hypothetical protein RclHR1_02980021 [Rhizophagus clarus]GES73146.1 hypothetical protein GLOIN_2v1784405 [Rhizophagus clarus]
MSFQFPDDCLNEIFEYLEEDKISLHSCLLVNRQWCRTSVRILWRNVWNFKYSVPYSNRLRIEKAILSTLIACLPEESKELLHRSEISILPITSKSPLFNYAAYCKVLSICEIGRIIDNVHKSESPITSLSLKEGNYLVVREIVKMFMDQITSLKKLTYYFITFVNAPNDLCFPEIKNYLSNLSELRCSSSIHSEFFYQLSQICHNLRSLTVEFVNDVSDELKRLIFLQNNLINLNLLAYGGNNWKNIIPALTKHSSTLKKIHLYSNNNDLSLSFITLFSNLQDIRFSFFGRTFGTHYFEDFKHLQHVIFNELKTLKFYFNCPKPEYIIKFLENNGKTIKEIYLKLNNNCLNLYIPKLCPNLRSLVVKFNSDELNTLITVFLSCKDLESIEIWCGKRFLNEKEVLEVIIKYSQKNFCKLKINNDSPSELSPNDLETFFIGWKNRKTNKPFNLIINKNNYNGLEVNENNMRMIKKYENLGIVKKLETKEFCDEED